MQGGLTEAGRLVLTGAPLEVSTALITGGVMNNILLAPTTGEATSDALGYIPLYIIGSALYGLAFALAYWAYTLGRPHAQVRIRGSAARAGAGRQLGREVLRGLASRVR